VKSSGLDFNLLMSSSIKDTPLKTDAPMGDVEMSIDECKPGDDPLAQFLETQEQEPSCQEMLPTFMKHNEEFHMSQTSSELAVKETPIADDGDRSGNLFTHVNAVSASEVNLQLLKDQDAYFSDCDS
jgi:hypothetical protein